MAVWIDSLRPATRRKRESSGSNTIRRLSGAPAWSLARSFTVSTTRSPLPKPLITRPSNSGKARVASSPDTAYEVPFPPFEVSPMMFTNIRAGCWSLPASMSARHR